MSNQELSERMDALSEQLDDFEKRFASADPEVKQMLAHLISNPSAAEELALASDTPTITQHQTPNSSDSAQTQSAADSAQQRWGFSSPSPAGDLGALHGSPQRPTLSPARRMGDIESSPMFPALTPSNSLAQQVTSRESLSDCAASFPTTLPSMNQKDAALANHLRHRLAGIDHPSSNGTIRESLTQVSISETAECTFPAK